MRKSLFLTLVLSLCVADFSAFAAAPRRGTGTAPEKTATQQAPVSARAGVRQKVASAPATTSTAAAPVSARAGARQKVVSTPASTATGNVAARAATKKALSMGTKVAEATENTVVSQECQNAYYGCMDAFCMLDNATGGRCQCSDRSEELDAVLDEIMRIDEQSSRIATEGVEQIQMGEYANQVNSKVKSVENGIASTKNSSSVKKSSSSTSRTLDLSAFSTTNFFDVEDDTVFDNGAENTLIADVTGKTGDNLQKAAAKICVAQAPAECKSSLSMLQMAYVQKVKSDCVGYENALKQQKSASQQKLLAAQKAVRDAALDEVRRQNAYETAGECAIAFAQCMQTTAECGSDYTGCVTLAAAENVKNGKTKGSIAKQTTIKGLVAGADITLAASTMEQLLAKKEICASVTRQCVNANKNDAVWDVFLRNAAPALRSAELIAEQNLRSNCIPTVAECFKTACKSQFGENDESYDMCLSNPATYKALCKVQLEPCLEATGGSFDKAEESSLWNGLVAMLNSMKVDACTKEIKDCLLSEDRCGKDFSNCIGLDTASIGNICPIEKLTACVTDGRYAQRGTDGTVVNEDEIREYVAQVAQGLALNIDNSFLTQCQNAANEAMIKVCGDTESCDNIAFDLSTVESMMEVKACKWGDKEGTNLTCLPDVTQFGDDEVYAMTYNPKDGVHAELKRGNTNSYGVYATLLNKPDISNITFSNATEEVSKGEGENAEMTRVSKFVISSGSANSEVTKKVVEILEAALNRTVSQIEADPKVIYCKTGREVQGFNANKSFGKKGEGRFPNLTDEYKYVIASGLLNKLSEKNLDLLEKFDDKIDEMSIKITERVAAIAKKRGDAVEEAVDKQNKENCDKFNTGWYGGNHWPKQRRGNYDTEENICTEEFVHGYCPDWHSGGIWRSSYCDADYIEEKVDVLRQIKMPKFQ